MINLIDFLVRKNRPPLIEPRCQTYVPDSWQFIEKRVKSSQMHRMNIYENIVKIIDRNVF